MLIYIFSFPSTLFFSKLFLLMASALVSYKSCPCYKQLWVAEIPDSNEVFLILTLLLISCHEARWSPQSLQGENVITEQKTCLSLVTLLWNVILGSQWITGTSMEHSMKTTSPTHYQDPSHSIFAHFWGHPIRSKIGLLQGLAPCFLSICSKRGNCEMAFQKKPSRIKNVL